MLKLYNWIDDRLEINTIATDITTKYVPPYVNIFYCFGGLVFTSFLLQIATRFAITFYYQPNILEAFHSVEYIIYTVNYGWFVRSAHRWRASFIILCLILHIFRVYLTRRFKKPRELTWITRVLLAVCAVSFRVTRYSLPYDQVGYWALRIVSRVPDCLPLIGQNLVELIRGRRSVRQATLTRFYSLHTFVLPVVATGLLLFHFLIIRKQGISRPL